MDTWKKFEEEYLKLGGIFDKLEPNKMADDFRENEIKTHGISPSEMEIDAYITGILATLEKLQTLGYFDEN